MQGNWLKQKNKLVIVFFGLALIAFFIILTPSVLANSNLDLGVDAASRIGLGGVDLKTLIVRLVRIVLGFVGLLAVIMILYGGYTFMTAGGNQDKVEKAKKILRNASIGLLIIITAFSIAEFIFRQLGWAMGVNTTGRFDQSYQYSGGIGGGAIKSHYPPRGAVGVPRNVSIVVTFKEKIDRSTVYDQTTGYIKENIIIKDADGNENQQVKAITEDDNSFVFTPDQYLGRDDQNVTYTVTLDSGLLKQNGDPVFGATGSYEWQFTVSTVIDLTPPKVLGVFPTANLTFPRNVVLQINFSEPINPLSASGEVGNGFDKIVAQALGVSQPINGTYNIVNQYRTVEFITNDLCGRNSCGYDVYCLPGNKDINILIKAAALADPAKPTAVIPFNGVVDMANNSLDGNGNSQAEGPVADNYQWAFKTNNAIDLNPPVVTGVTPGVSTINVGTRATVKSTFNKLMMYSTLNAENIMIDQNIMYWITSYNDPAAFTISLINHDEFTEYTPYHPLITNKCMDVFQNCFNPAAGPNDLKVGGDDPTNGWLRGQVSGSASFNQVIGQLRLNINPVTTPYVWFSRNTGTADQLIRFTTTSEEQKGPYAVTSLTLMTAIDSRNRAWLLGTNCQVSVIETNAAGVQISNRTINVSPVCNGTMAIDGNNNLWIVGSGKLTAYSGQDSDFGQRIFEPIDLGPSDGLYYGAVIDRGGNFWTADARYGKLIAYDTTNKLVIRNYQIKSPGGEWFYGMTADQDGDIWLAGYRGLRQVGGVSGHVVTKVNASRFVSGEVTNLYTEYLTGGADVRGIVTDRNNNIWATNYNTNNVVKFKNDGTVLNVLTVGNNPLSLSTDASGNIWVVNVFGQGPLPKYSSCTTSTVTKINGSTNAVLGTYCLGGSSFSGGDLSGFGYHSIIQPYITGQWTSPNLDMYQPVVVTGLFAHGDLPVGTSVEIEGRSATSSAALTSATWQKTLADGSLQLPQGNWLQIRATLKSTRIDQTPSLNNISISISGQ